MTKTLRLFYYFIALCPFINQAQIHFSPFVEKATGSWPETVAIGDMNNDGLNDVVLGTSSYSSTNDWKILVFLQNTNGTLSPYTDYSYMPAGHAPTMDIADLNQDGLKDVVIAADNTICIFYQNSNGTLNPMTTISTSQLVSSLKCADINNDSKTDFAVAFIDSNYVSTYIQGTAGNFTAQNYPLPNTMSIDELEIGDINNDSKKDIVCVSVSPSGIYSLKQNATNGFNTSVYTTILGITGIDIGDLNGDGKTDVAYTKYGNTPLSKIGLLYQNTSSQLYNSAIELSAYDGAELIEIADLNNDGKNEIIVAHGGWENASVYQKNSSNVFSSYSLFPIPISDHYNLQGMAVGDINHDGKKDIVVADVNRGLIILYSTTTLDINENSSKASVVVYPNPTTNYLSIENKNNLELSYEITDTNGKILQNDILNRNSHIDVSQLQAGFYFITIRNEFEKTTYKFIKN
ncbi:T9SS type A sorting domain-containing protein [Flavobacterium sp.]|uniref:T9SS type A sorting domain-containing protein n=1 Tax=Flavobacterium sp. TaxID=239 RepID=UPI002487FDD1|nr:T9SS type A sorting domain-containing protein [Flavobacterium sp.]MDI1315890.1 T9SS type A sorting domain-containing protein [Flavobacterium sp.]